jgi:hypothetical protein
MAFYWRTTKNLRRTFLVVNNGATTRRAMYRRESERASERARKHRGISVKKQQSRLDTVAGSVPVTFPSMDPTSAALRARPTERWLDPNGPMMRCFICDGSTISIAHVHQTLCVLVTKELPIESLGLNQVHILCQTSPLCGHGNSKWTMIRQLAASPNMLKREVF